MPEMPCARISGIWNSLSKCSSAVIQQKLRVLRHSANGVEAVIQEHDGATPTPVISRAILVHNRGRSGGLADGIVITPSHNPPADGGFKYNPPNGGPADTNVTGAIEKSANAIAAMFRRARIIGRVADDSFHLDLRTIEDPAVFSVKLETD